MKVKMKMIEINEIVFSKVLEIAEKNTNIMPLFSHRTFARELLMAYLKEMGGMPLFYFREGDINDKKQT